MNIYSPSREERAFLYQEAQDLEPLMRNLGSLSVVVEEMVPSSKSNSKKELSSHYRVTFVVAPESVGMKVQATDKNLYDATIAAKLETVRQLNAIVNSMPRSREDDGQTTKPPSGLLH